MEDGYVLGEGLTDSDMLQQQNDRSNRKLSSHRRDELGRNGRRSNIAEARRDGLQDGDRVVLGVLVDGHSPGGLVIRI